MKVLTLNNESFDLNNLPDELEEAFRFSVLDNSDPSDPDFFFIPLVFLESFSSPAIVLDIRGNEIIMPVDWHIAVGDSRVGKDLEVLPLTSINDRGFEAFLFNPRKSYKADYSPIKVNNYYNDVKWFFPKIKTGQLLSVPLSDEPDPLCAFFCRDISKQHEVIDFCNLI